MKSGINLFITFILLCLISNIFAQNQFENSLILHYPFDGNGKEIQKKGKSLKVDDDPKKLLFLWISDKDGKANSALQFLSNFTGLKTGINISPKKMPEFTFTAWVYGRPSGHLFGTTLPQSEMTKIISRTLLFSYDAVGAGYMYYSNRDGKEYVAYLRSSKLPEDQWNFIALTVNAKDSTMILYAGNEYYQAFDKDNLVKVFHTPKGGEMLIGNNASTASSNQFRGKVDDIRVYNKCLTANELTQISGINFTDARVRIEREKLINEIIMIVILLFFVFMIVYSIIVIIKEKKSQYKEVTEAEFEEFKSEAKSTPDISVTNELAFKYIEDEFNSWPEVSRDEENVFRAPRKRKQILSTYAALEKARKLKPSEKYIIDRMNELGGICNNLSTRRFFGNKFLPIAGSIFPIIFLLIEGFKMQSILTFLVLMLPIFAYIVTAFAPAYLVANRKRGSGGLIGIIIGAIIGAGSATMATQYYNEITWSDGRKTVEYDTGSNLASLLIGIIFLAIALFLSLILSGVAAIISFFRNYVFFK